MAFYEWRPYVPVARRRADAQRKMQRLREKGLDVQPVEIQGQKIARTFWGKAWCDHLEHFSDYENRLPRGRTYVRNGSVCHLAISKGRIEAKVSGSDLYDVQVKITPLPAGKWKNVRKRCTGRIGSMLELLQGRLSDSVMEVVTHRTDGLFPQPREIRFDCSCPDWAYMCKHVAAVLYGIGARLDQRPELLFLLRNVDHQELIGADLDVHAATAGTGKRRRLAGGNLSDVFGLEIDDAPAPGKAKKAPTTKQKSSPPRRSVAASGPRKPAASGKRRPRAAARKPAAPPARSRAAAVTRKTVARRAKRPAADFRPTAANVARLRRRFGMNQRQFADILGVSPASVSHWENSSGRLGLRQQTLEALQRAAALTEKQAWRKLSAK